MKTKKYTKETIREIGMEKRNFPEFAIGDTIAVSQKVVEAGKERIQSFEGDVIAMHHNGISTTFTVRKIGANMVPVEKIFPYYSPLITGIKFIRRGKVRRAKLYYLRQRIGKAARVKELVLSKEEKKEQKKGKQDQAVEVEQSIS